MEEKFVTFFNGSSLRDYAMRCTKLKGTQFEDLLWYKCRKPDGKCLLVEFTYFKIKQEECFSMAAYEYESDDISKHSKTEEVRSEEIYDIFDTDIFENIEDEMRKFARKCF